MENPMIVDLVLAGFEIWEPQQRKYLRNSNGGGDGWGHGDGCENGLSRGGGHGRGNGYGDGYSIGGGSGHGYGNNSGDGRSRGDGDGVDLALHQKMYFYWSAP